MMPIKPNHNISAEKAINLLNQGLTISNSYIEERIEIIDQKWDRAIVFDSCIIEDFDFTLSESQKPVSFKDVHFKNCSFRFSYFLNGLTLENCVFEKGLDFSAGEGLPIVINNNRFMGFVNFFDCSFKGEVYIDNNTFLKGTNIESRKQMISFDIQPIIINNKGQTNIEGESAD